MPTLSERLDALERGQGRLRADHTAFEEAIRRMAGVIAWQGSVGDSTDRRTAMGRLSEGSLTGLEGAWREHPIGSPPQGVLGASMLARLRRGEGITTGVASGSPGGRWSFRGNMLVDPALEQIQYNDMAHLTLTGAYQDLGPGWKARGVLNSGPAGGSNELWLVTLRSATLSPGLHSSRLNLSFGAGINASRTFYLQSKTAQADISAPYVVAAVRLIRVTMLGDITSLTARVQILDSAGATVISQSDAIDLAAALVAERDDVLLWCAREAPYTDPAYPGDPYSHWRLRIDLAAGAGGGSFIYAIAEPQLQGNGEPAPPLYTPGVGGWVPTSVAGAGPPTTAFGYPTPVVSVGTALSPDQL